MTISLGVHVGQQNLEMDAMRALWRRLDAAKVDWISTWDHFLEAPYQGGDQPHFEAVATLGALAAETQHARLGCLVFYVGYRNPALLAKVATTLDHISGGRFELGLGAGWHIDEAIAYGYPFPDIGTRLDMLNEAVELIRRLLTEPRTTYSGRHFQADDASCLPVPVQERMPIWIGGRGEKRTLEIVARHADGWNAAYTGPEEFTRLSHVLDEWCESAGRAPDSIARGANVSFNVMPDDKAVAVERSKLESEWGAAADRIIEGSLLCTPEAVVDNVMTYVEAGANAINIALRAPWDEDCLSRYLEEAIPAIKHETGG